MELTNEEKDLCQKLRDRMADVQFEDREFRTRDYHLIRFLRARNLDLDKAEDMYRKQVEWRLENDLANALSWDIAPDLKENLHYRLTGLSNDGDLVLFANVGEWDPKLAHGRYSELLKVTYFILEELTQIYKILTLQQNRAPQAIVVVNLEGISFAHVTCVDWIRCLTLLLKCFEAYFPETLKVAYMLNAPWVFSMLWSIVKPFISANTHKRIQFLGNDKNTWKENFAKFMAEDQFSVAFGGTLPDDFELLYIDGKLEPNQDCSDKDKKQATASGPNSIKSTDLD